MKKFRNWIVGIVIAVGFISFLTVGKTIWEDNGPSKEIPTVKSPVKTLPTGAWRVSQKGIACKYQEVFLEIRSNFDRYDKASATERMQDSLQRRSDDHRHCVILNPGEVVHMRETDKWLHTVWIDREKDDESYYSSLDILGLAQ